MRKLPMEERDRRIRERKRKYYQENKEREAKKNKEHYQKNKEEILKRNKKYREQNREKILAQKRNKYHIELKYDMELMQRKRETTAKWQKEHRKKCIEHYSNHSNKCVLCGEDDYDVLVIDHIDGGGTQHRKQINSHIIRYLIKNNFPKGYRILCMNCNIKEARIKGFFGSKQFIDHQKSNSYLS